MTIIIIKWWIILSLLSLAGVGLILLYDRIKYGPLKSYEDENDY